MPGKLPVHSKSPTVEENNVLTSGPKYGTWRGTVFTSKVLERHSMTVISRERGKHNFHYKN